MANKRARPLPRAFALPWGRGHIVQEASFAGKHHEPVIQLLRFDDGYDCLRFCYYVRGRFQDKPVILGDDDLRGLRRALANAPEIAELLRKLSSAGGARQRRSRPGEQPLTHTATRGHGRSQRPLTKGSRADARAPGPRPQRRRFAAGRGPRGLFTRPRRGEPTGPPSAAGMGWGRRSSR